MLCPNSIKQILTVQSFFLVVIMCLLIGIKPAHSGVCASDASDPDGDGFGVENNQVCIVVKPCVSRASDPDGDGWGWENNKSCVITTTTGTRDTTASQCIDDDGDGWGWDGFKSCKPNAQCIDTTPIGDGWGWNGTHSCRIQPTQSAGSDLSQITDVVLITGQSNTLGTNTTVTPGIDDPTEGVYAWTDKGWQVADLCQVWDLGWHPRTTPDGKNPHNNFGLHFGKQVATNSGRVVAFILVSAPGMPISTWDTDKPLFSKIRTQVETALNALPHIDKLSGILWHQGENDWHGGNHYQTKLTELINNFRNEQWLDQRAPFICGETYSAPVNANLNSLNYDNDIRTACVSSAGLGVQSDKVHFDAEGLRVLGRRYGAKYLDIMSGGASSL